MIFENLDAWVSIDSKRLVEYGRVRSKKDTVECWIESEEGSKFELNWDLIKRPKRARLGLVAHLHLDGLKIPHRFMMTPPDISDGDLGFWDGVITEEGDRNFVFGKLQTTGEVASILVQSDTSIKDVVDRSDCEDVAPLADAKQQELHTIKLKLSWIHGCKKVYFERSNDSTGLEAGKSSSQSTKRLVNEKSTKKGHTGSAELGPAIPKAPQPTSPKRKGKKARDWYWDYEVADSPVPSYFIFHYAPKGKFFNPVGRLPLTKDSEWLRDRGIIRQTTIVSTIDITKVQEPSQNDAEDRPTPHETRAIPESSEQLALNTPPLRNDSSPFGGSFRIKRERLDPDMGAEPSRLSKSENRSNISSNNVTTEPDFDQDPNATGRATPTTSRLSNPALSTTSAVIPAKRERPQSPVLVIDVDAISSDDEVVLLDIKPPKDHISKRLCVKVENEESKPIPEAIDVKPNGDMQQEIDPWRLGC
ncbi:hypothetical protein RhiJN_05591 [Ceratobasidium sp. AG-Ba]|nr:hypothetical protein RhiJN_05591 [Ceratobasidium sp. AG-Ba]